MKHVIWGAAGPRIVEGVAAACAGEHIRVVRETAIVDLDPRTGEARAERPIAPIHRAWWARDGSALAVLPDSGVVRAIDGDTGRELGEVHVYTDGVVEDPTMLAVAVAPGGRRLYVERRMAPYYDGHGSAGSHDWSMMLVELGAAPLEDAVWARHDDWHAPVAIFTRDGQRVFSASEETATLLTPATSGFELEDFGLTHRVPVEGLILSPDDRWLVARTPQGLVCRDWHASDAYTLGAVLPEVVSIDCSPGSDAVAALGADGSLTVLRLPGDFAG